MPFRYTYLMYFDGEHTFTITTQIGRTQPFRVIITALIDANVLFCIVFPVIILFPSVCGCVRGDFQLIYFN
jgi:hypothetical protein